MRFARVSNFYGMHVPPVSIVVGEDALRTTLEDMLHQLAAHPGFVTWEIFEDPRDLVETIQDAMERMDDAREQNMATLYFYDVMMLSRCAPHGLISTTQPSPLDRESIELTLGQIALHPQYKHQTIVVHDVDGNPVTMTRGEIEP